MIIELQLNCTGGWMDYSKWVNITRLVRESSLTTDNDPQKVQTGTIELFGDAYTFVEANLISGPNMYSNSMCIRVTDDVCSGDQYYFKIDNRNLKWCDDQGCTMEFEMQGYEPELDCVRHTTIADNTNGWFDEYGPFDHPRFRYCDVIKPTLFFAFIMALSNIVDLLIVGVNGAINALNSFLPGLNLQPISLLGNALSGCKRAFPSPFIRTYIDNVCNVCGLYADNTTIPVFYDLFNPLQPVLTNPYYNATMLTAYTKKGVDANGNKTYIRNNQPSWTFDVFLSKLKKLWNARWFIHNGKVYFHRKDKIGELIWGSTPVLDFTGDDAKKILNGVCFSWNGEGKLKRKYMKYGTDSTDAIGNEVLNRFNGQYLDTSSNPNYTEAEEIANDDFGTASFVNDLNDSEYDWWLMSSFYGMQLGTKGPLKTTTDTCALAKIIIYDDSTPILDARAVSSNYYVYVGLLAFLNDNYYYNQINPYNGWYYNSPMSFDPLQNTLGRNLWQYHEIDVPSDDKKTNIAFEFTIQYCCEFNNLNIYQKVVMKNGDIGEISSVIFDHYNRTINVKGNLL